MKVEFHPEAAQEFYDQVRYFESLQVGLGTHFESAVEKAAVLISEFPESRPIIRETIRRCGVPAFPFGLLYTIEPDAVYVLAVAHARRYPGYWSARLAEPTPTN